MEKEDKLKNQKDEYQEDRLEEIQATIQSNGFKYLIEDEILDYIDIIRDSLESVEIRDGFSNMTDQTFFDKGQMFFGKTIISRLDYLKKQ